MDWMFDDEINKRKKIPQHWPWVLRDAATRIVARFENPNDAELVVKALEAYALLNSLTSILNLAHKTTIE